MKKIVTLFPKYKDHHFFKDPGQIAYRLSKIGYDASIVCYKNEKEYYNTKKHIKVFTIPNNKLFRKFDLGIVLFILFNSRKIGILSIFHLKWESLLCASLYKLINSKGFVYLKMDNCHYSGIYPWEKIFDPNKEPTNVYTLPENKEHKFKNFLIKKYFVQKVDLWSIEDEGSKNYYEKNYSFLKDKIITVYNGHTIDLEEEIVVKSFSEKEDIILSVGRFGTFQKATDILLQSFILIMGKCNWNLHLAGSVEERFKNTISSYFNRYPNLKDRVIFHGKLEKKSLYELYNRSRIFCFPSRFEAFAIVFPEAMYFGNAIITTAYTSVRDIIANEKLGIIVEKDDAEGLSKAILKIINNRKLNNELYTNSKNYAEKNLNWDKIVQAVHNEINNRIG